MYAKSFIAYASRGRPTSAATAKTYPYDRYVCHLCKSTLVFHPECSSERPWFEHTKNTMTDNGRKHCPYLVIEPEEMRLIRRLRRLVTDVHPIVRQADWYCMECDKHYNEERYCLSCRTGTNSAEVPARLTLLRTPGAEDVTCV